MLDRGDRRGDRLLEMVQALDLMVCNSGHNPTREKDGHQSFIGVTLASARLHARVSNWTVLLSETLSDHNYIVFTVGAAPVTKHTP